MLRNYIDRLTFTISTQNLFPQIPTISFKPPISSFSMWKKVENLENTYKNGCFKKIGEFKAREVILICDCCQTIYHSEELRTLVPPHSKFGFDVLISIGKALFLQGHNEKEIQRELLEKNINISRREIGYLGKKIMVYLALSHRACQDKIRKFMSLRGGYLLHLDGTCEKDSPHLISALDGITEIVLDNIKLPWENAEQIIPFLKEIKKSYGEPIALVHDMGKGILNAVQEVEPKTANFICHFHFLRDIGKDLFSEENTRLRKAYTTSKIRSVLRETLKKLKLIIESDSELNQGLETYLTDKKWEQSHFKLMPPITAYVIIIWILEAHCELNGFGFPFDRLHLVFYQRLESAFLILNNLKNEKILQIPLSQLIQTLSELLNDKLLQKKVIKMSEKVEIFEPLRKAMRIAQPSRKKGLNDDGDEQISIQTIEKKVKRFRQSHKLQKRAKTDVAYQKMLKQIDKYWEKLFADPIQVPTSLGTIAIVIIDGSKSILNKSNT